MAYGAWKMRMGFRFEELEIFRDAIELENRKAEAETLCKRINSFKRTLR